MREEIKSIASYVDKYIHTCLNYKQSLCKIRNSEIGNKFPNEFNNKDIPTHDDLDVNLTVDYMKK